MKVDVAANEIDALVTASLAGPRSVFVAHVQNESEYIESIRHRFDSDRIFPELTAVKIRDYIAPFVSYPEGVHQFFFVCKSDSTSVFYDPKCGMFGAAWGPDSDTNEYLDLGQRDSDVLAMLAA